MKQKKNILKIKLDINTGMIKLEKSEFIIKLNKLNRLSRLFVLLQDTDCIGISCCECPIVAFDKICAVLHTDKHVGVIPKNGA